MPIEHLIIIDNNILYYAHAISVKRNNPQV